MANYSGAEVLLPWGVFVVKSEIEKNKVHLFVEFKTRNDDHYVLLHYPLLEIDDHRAKW